jgi:hypothetical protein
MRFFLFAFAALAAVNPALNQVHSIYVMPMGSSMDQFLANRLTKFGKFQVVADPRVADAVLTDRLGEAFEAKMKELYEEKVKKAKDADKDKDKDKDKESADEPVLKSDQQLRPAFGRSKGTYFIVDRKTRAVLWSIYQRPKNMTADELNKTADRVIKQLKVDLVPPKESRT